MTKQYRFLAVFFSVLFTHFLLTLPVSGQNTVVSYAGTAQVQRFNEVLELSDGSLVVVGEQEGRNFDWIPIAPRQILPPNAPAENIDNEGYGGAPPVTGFILHISEDLQTILSFIQFPENAVESITHVRTDAHPFAATGNLYISGMSTSIRRNDLGDALDGTGAVTTDPDDYVATPGYFVARLDNNFLNGEPTRLDWAWNVRATGDHRERQPWDVGSDGKVVYAEGTPDGNGWAAVRRLRANGLGNDLVENWRYHFGRYKADGQAVEGAWTPAFSNNLVIPEESALPYVADTRCSLRSWSNAEYIANLGDETGRNREGSWPMDTFYAGYCDINNPATTMAQGGYIGYRLNNNTTHRIGAITVDRRTNDMYIGSSIASATINGLPDFEPMVIGFTSDGTKKWWARLYEERTPQQSPPDQYIDGLGIDYSQTGSLSSLLVIGRQHGNSDFAFWENTQTDLNPLNTGDSFHTDFTGTNGNIHISWIGKYRLTNGDLLASSWSAGYLNIPVGTPYADPNLDGWISHNSGTNDLNTNFSKIHIETDRAGNVYVLSYARQFVTTATAYQEQAQDGTAVWAPQIRVFSPDLKTLIYGSSLTGIAGNNTDLFGVAPSGNSVVVVGQHLADAGGNAIGGNTPTINEPTWGRSDADGETALIARLMYMNDLTADFAISPFEGTCVGEDVIITDLSINADPNDHVWDFGVDATAVNLGTDPSGPYRVSWSSAGTKSISLQVEDEFNTATDMVTKTYEVTAPPTTTAVTQAVDISVASQTVTLNAPAGADFYEWRFYDLVSQDTIYYSGTSGQQHTFELRGTYEGFLRVRSGTCEAEVPFTVTVTGGPGDVDPRLTANPTIACFGEEVTFDDVVSDNIVTWEWAFGQDAFPTTATGPGPHQVVYNDVGNPFDTGERTALLTVGNGRIERSSTVTLNVAATVDASFTVSNPTPARGENITFTPTVNDPNFTYRWTFGDPFVPGNTSTNRTPNFSYQNEGTYFAFLEISTPQGCTNTSSVQIIVGDPNDNTVPQPDFAITPANQTCVYNNVQVTDMSRGYQQETREWDFGEDAVVQVAGSPTGPRPDSVYWTTPGEKIIVLKVDAGNGNPITKVYSERYTVSPYPTAFFQIEGDACSNPAQLTLDARTTPGSYYNWEFTGIPAPSPTTSTSTQPEVEFNANGTAELTVVNNGCRSVIARSIKIGGDCNNLSAAIIVKPARQDCGEQQFIVEGYANGEVTTWNWNFNGAISVLDLDGNPTTPNNVGTFIITYDPSSIGSHTIDLMVTGPNGDTDNVQVQLEILPE